MKIEEIVSILCELHKISGLRVSLHGTDFKEIAAYPEQRLPFCSLIQEDKGEFRQCELCDIEASEKVQSSGQPLIYKCRHGLCEVVCPLYNFGTLTGYLMMGQVADETTDKEKITSTLLALSHDISQAKITVSQIPYIDSEKLASYVHIMTICAEYMTMTNALPSNTPGVPELAKMYLHQNYSQKITIPDMCKSLSCSKSSLLSSFKREYGVTIINYLYDIRVAEAKRLLEFTGMSICDIAEVTGFYDQSYFSKLFTREVGMTPSDFRKEVRK